MARLGNHSWWEMFDLRSAILAVGMEASRSV